MAPFPRRRWLTDNDRLAIEKVDALREVLDELIWRVHGLWQQDKDNEPLGIANIEIHFSGVAVQDVMLVIGRLVIKPARYYFDAREMLSETSLQFLRDFLDGEAKDYLEKAVKLDQEIRQLVAS